MILNHESYLTEKDGATNAPPSLPLARPLPSPSLLALCLFFFYPPRAMLPYAVLPPSREHSYAQWLERTYHACEDGPAQAPSLPDTKPLTDAATSSLLKSHGDKPWQTSADIRLSV